MAAQVDEGSEMQTIGPTEALQLDESFGSRIELS
jgi:hypothetical protein